MGGRGGPENTDAKNFYLIISIFLPLHPSPDDDGDGGEGGGKIENLADVSFWTFFPHLILIFLIFNI
jgi:hypothetical protein